MHIFICLYIYISLSPSTYIYIHIYIVIYLLMLHDVLILVPLFIQIIKSHQTNVSFHIVFPQKGTFTLTPGMEEGGDHPPSPPQSQTISTNSSYGNCSHFWNIFTTNLKKSYLFNFICTENDTESIYNIQNISF